MNKIIGSVLIILGVVMGCWAVDDTPAELGSGGAVTCVSTGTYEDETQRNLTPAITFTAENVRYVGGFVVGFEAFIRASVTTRGPLIDSCGVQVEGPVSYSSYFVAYTALPAETVWISQADLLATAEEKLDTVAQRDALKAQLSNEIFTKTGIRYNF